MSEIKDKVEEKIEVFLKEGCRVSPNCFSLDLREDEKEKFVFSFADMNKEKGRVDVLSEVSVSENGFKTILKSVIEVACEYENKSGVDLIKQLFDGEEGVVNDDKC